MVILRHRLPGGWLRSIEDCSEGPEIPVAHQVAVRLFTLHKGCCRPARRHSRSPAAHSAGAPANSRVRVIDDVTGSQTAMQRTWHIQSINVEALLQALEQRTGRVGIIGLQPGGNLPKLVHAFFLAELPGCPHQRTRLRLLVARQSPEHVAQLMVSTALYRMLTKYRVDGRAQR